MTAKDRSLAEKVTLTSEAIGFRISAIAYECGIPLKRLQSFVDGTGGLNNSEISSLLEFLDLYLMEVESDQRNYRNLTVGQFQFDAIADDLVSHSLAYVVNNEVATGTFVTIGKREFIATAAHTIPKNESPILLIGNGTTELDQAGVHVVSMGRKKDCSPDVGYIEVRPGTAKRLGRLSIGVDRICDAGPGQSGRYAYLYGFPAAFAKRLINRKEKFWVLGLSSLSYAKQVLAVSEWPAVPRSVKPARPSVDVFLPYDITEETSITHVKSRRLPVPGGISGGGFWQSTMRKGAIWHTDTMKLFAIQSTWNEQRKYVRGVQIKHWVRLIRTNYPDLEAELAKVLNYSAT